MAPVTVTTAHKKISLLKELSLCIEQKCGSWGGVLPRY